MSCSAATGLLSPRRGHDEVLVHCRASQFGNGPKGSGTSSSIHRGHCDGLRRSEARFRGDWVAVLQRSDQRRAQGEARTIVMRSPPACHRTCSIVRDCGGRGGLLESCPPHLARGGLEGALWPPLYGTFSRSFRVVEESFSSSTAEMLTAVAAPVLSSNTSLINISTSSAL